MTMKPNPGCQRIFWRSQCWPQCQEQPSLTGFHPAQQPLWDPTSNPGGLCWIAPANPWNPALNPWNPAPNPWNPALNPWNPAPNPSHILSRNCLPRILQQFLTAATQPRSRRPAFHRIVYIIIITQEVFGL